ncbi:histidine triad nucleotide-binding protein 3 [Drosophila guanche]|uniref:Adenosine 5'-monophosphoramidase HINT3 n=1 Tax=Drosophila guanche TaxID=7266 RepID=A0A3B0KH52_DROGU|nr:histidine triad nucleotide-binding protein 3 [Drosophila guanche]SPP85066.1 blast:Histidine triad nucleotide-binding protein 3 [Drosophila guanche]
MLGESLSLFKRKKTIFAALAGLGLLGLVAVYNCGANNPTAAALQDKCLFCDFANGRQGPPPVLEVQTDEYVIFKDKSPAATYHYLAIPKQHFDSFSVLNRSHIGLVMQMESGMVELLKSKNVDPSKAIIGFHIPPFISVKHLHLHGIYPPSEMSLWNRINFMSSFWFKTAKDANEALELREL